MASFKISETDEINKFIETVTTAYKDKGKTPDLLFYEIVGNDNVRIGKCRRGLTLGQIEAELAKVAQEKGEGKYFLRDAEVKIEVTVTDLEKVEAEKPGKKVAKSDKVVSKTEKNSKEHNMSDRTILDAVKESGMDAIDKALHGAQVAGAGKVADQALLKIWDKTGKNEFLAMALQDPFTKALIKFSLGTLVKTVGTEKSNLPGSEYAVKAADLVIEGAGAEVVGPLLDMLMPMLGDFATMGKEIMEKKEGSVDDEKVDYEALEAEMKKAAEKKTEAKVATA